MTATPPARAALDPHHDGGLAGARPAVSAIILIRGLFWDVGLSVVTYYALRLAGNSEWVALLGATLVAGLRIGWIAMRDRKLNPFATLMLVVFGLGLALAFISGDPRLLLLKHSVISGAVGIAFLVSIVAGRPLTLSAAQNLRPDDAQRLEIRYRTDFDVRHGFRIIALVWGLGQLAEALIRVPLIYLLPIDVMVGLSTALMVVINGALIMWTVRYVARRRQRSNSSDR
ncbi:MAG TPA: VC0807 family protein [Pseudonocardiaceae bacterium]|jgi:hypothetical protein|nr:VC0807 family protein [Pseudonocardiaceae bacterium]